MGREAKILLGIAFGVAVVVSGLIIANSSNTAQVQPKADGDKLVKADSHQTKPGAKVTLVEFGDIQCPACGQAQPVIEQVRQQYPDTVNLVFRHFPLRQIHQNAENAAQASEAGGEQGKFFELVSLMYAKQAEWSNLPNPYPKFEEYAKSLGLDIGQFKSAYDAKKFTELIKRDEADGSALGVNATPTFYVNGQQTQTAQLKASVDTAVKQ